MNRQVLDHLDSWTTEFRNVSPVIKGCLRFKIKLSREEEHSSPVCCSRPGELEWAGVGWHEEIKTWRGALRCLFNPALVVLS